MKTGNGFSSATRVLFVLAAFVVVVAGLRSAESLMVTFLLSGFLPLFVRRLFFTCRIKAYLIGCH